MNIEETIKILEKFTTEHKLFNIKHSDGLEEAIETLLTAYEIEKEKNKKAIDFINDKNNYFEDGENWQNILKIKEILEK